MPQISFDPIREDNFQTSESDRNKFVSAWGSTETTFTPGKGSQIRLKQGKDRRAEKKSK